MKRVVMAVSPNEGYGVDQIERSVTLGQLKEKIEDAINYYGEDCIIVTHNSGNRYGAKYGRLYNEEIVSEDEWGEGD